MKNPKYFQVSKLLFYKQKGKDVWFWAMEKWHKKSPYSADCWIRCMKEKRRYNPKPILAKNLKYFGITP